METMEAKQEESSGTKCFSFFLVFVGLVCLRDRAGPVALFRDLFYESASGYGSERPYVTNQNQNVFCLLKKLYMHAILSMPSF